MRTIIVASFLMLVGCATTEPLRLTATGEQRLKASDAVEVAISDADRARVDPYIMAFGNTGRQPVETGPIWRRAFVGDPKRDPLFTIDSAQVRESLSGLGFTMRYTYVIDGRIALDGREYPIHAEGSRAAAMALPSAMRQAVELGVIDAAQQAAALVKSKAPNKAPEPTPGAVTPRATEGASK